jgi:hypothetical protein
MQLRDCTGAVSLGEESKPMLRGRQGVVGDRTVGRLSDVKQRDLCGSCRWVFMCRESAASGNPSTKSQPHRSQSVRSSEEAE